MALGKGRHSKRSSSTSYTSTITTVVVIALCVLGVWMLTSDSIASPQSTTRTSAPDERTTANTISTKADDKSFEDNPGDLPDDAVKNGDQKPDTSKDDATESNDSGGNEGLNQNDRSENGGEAAGESKKDEGQTNGTDQSGVDENNTQGLHGQDSAEEQTKENREEIHESAEESSVTQTQKPTDNNLETGTLTSSDDKENNAAENSKGNDEGGNEGQDQIKSENSIQAGENIDNDPQAGRKGDSSQEGETESGSSTTEEKPFFSDEDQPLGKQYPVKTSTLSDEASKNTTSTHDNEGKSKTEDTEQVESTRQSKTSYGTEETNQDPKQQEGGSSQGAAQDTPTSYENSSETSSLPNSGIPKESKESKKSWSTQVSESDNEKERRKDTSEGQNDRESMYGYSWHLCNVTAGQDYIPCLDNEEAIKKLRSRKHFEHRERHCPEEPPTCLVPLPEGYKTPVPWPQSRDKIWFHNVPHKELAEVKGHQNWVKLTGEFLTFPGGGTQFIHGALHYIDFIQKAVPAIAWGRHTRVILDVGCGVASFGGYLFERDVLAISLAPKDEHEAQVQFALERGIPAISAVMGSQRLPFPSNIFDVVHCARCRVPWHAEGGRLLLELNRLLRPGGFFVWSATPVYREFPEDVEIWKAMSTLTASMCWKVETIQKDDLNMIGAAIYRKPKSNECYEQRKENGPPMCKSDDDANAAWYVPLQSCMHRVPIDESERGSKWPARWPKRLATPPYWLNKSQMGIYGKPAPDDFTTDHEHWKKVLKTSYLTGVGFSWRNVRNVMDMRAVYGGFAAALKDLQIWVLNVVNVNSPDTLPIIYERGLFGIYHDWCESFSTYPRTYDLLHADHLFSKLKERCKLAPVMTEIDRILRPGGKLIVRDESSSIGEVENLLKSLHWEIHLTFSKDQEGILSAQKTDWRPNTYAAS